jgi:hypothetical protein
MALHRQTLVSKVHQTPQSSRDQLIDLSGVLWECDSQEVFSPVCVCLAHECVKEGCTLAKCHCAGQTLETHFEGSLHLLHHLDHRHRNWSRRW